MFFIREMVKEKPILHDTSDVFDASSTVVKFLNVFGLSRVSKTFEGAILLRDIRFKCALIVIIWKLYEAVAITSRFYWGYWTQFWGPDAYIELIHTVLLSLQFLLVTLTATYESGVLVCEYFDNLNKVDEILELNTPEHYAAERLSVDRNFFSLFFAYFAKMVCEIIFWSISFGLHQILPFTNDYLTNLVQMTAQFYFFVQLSLFRKRLDVMGQKLQKELKSCDEAKCETNQNRYSEVLQKYKASYVILYNHHRVINKIHGMKIMMSVVCVLISVIRTIYAMLIYSYEYMRGYVFVACVMRTIPDLVLLTALVVYVSRIVGLRERALDALERLLCTRPLSECEKASVLEFIDQIHRQPLRFTAHNFFTLDYSLLCGLLNSTVTYIIILTQIKAPTGGDVSTTVATR